MERDAVDCSRGRQRAAVPTTLDLAPVAHVDVGLLTLHVSDTSAVDFHVEYLCVSSVCPLSTRCRTQRTFRCPRCLCAESVAVAYAAMVRLTLPSRRRLRHRRRSRGHLSRPVAFYKQRAARLLLDCMRSGVLAERRTAAAALLAHAASYDGLATAIHRALRVSVGIQGKQRSIPMTWLAVLLALLVTIVGLSAGIVRAEDEDSCKQTRRCSDWA